MEALIKLVAERAGIDEGAAKTAIEVVISQLKDRLPEPMAAQLEGLLSAGGGGGGGDAADALGGLGNKLGF